MPPKSAKSWRFTCRSFPDPQHPNSSAYHHDVDVESRLWLEAIHRRLAGRLRVRNHFKVKLSETSPTSFSRVTKSKKVYRGICAVIRVLWRQQKVRNNFIFIIKRAKQLAVFTSLWPDRGGSCAILQEDSHREEKEHLFRAFFRLFRRKNDLDGLQKKTKQKTELNSDNSR